MKCKSLPKIISKHIDFLLYFIQSTFNKKCKSIYNLITESDGIYTNTSFVYKQRLHQNILLDNANYMFELFNFYRHLYSKHFLHLPFPNRLNGFGLIAAGTRSTWTQVVVVAIRLCSTGCHARQSWIP